MLKEAQRAAPGPRRTQLFLVGRIRGSFRDKEALELGHDKQVERGLAEMGGGFQALGTEWVGRAG